MSRDGDTALPCDGLCYKTVHKWTILVWYETNFLTKF